MGLAAAFLLTTAAAGERGATTAEAVDPGKVIVNIVYYAEDDCIEMTGVQEAPPAGTEQPQRTLVMTVTLERKPPGCPQSLRKIERRLTISDRADALSVDIFFVDKAGKLIRSQRPRIYRDTPEERECHAVSRSDSDTRSVAKC